MRAQNYHNSTHIFAPFSLPHFLSLSSSLFPIPQPSTPSNREAVIWAGTTTNESLKWSDWREEIRDGLAYRRRMSPSRAKDLRIEPAWTKWPVEADSIIVSSEDGAPRSEHIPGVGAWTQVRTLREVDNLYDLGFWDNLRDVFWPRYRFAKGPGIVPAAERGRGRHGRHGRASRRED